MEGEKRDKHMIEIQRTSCLPHDLIIEILSRVPPKSLSRFRCVSKQWHHLLTHDHEFIARHSKWSKKNPLLLTRRYILDENWGTSKTKATVELTSVNLDGNVIDKFKIVIDGLIQTFISCGPLSLISGNYSLYLCNPSFHELVRVAYRSRICLQNVGIGYVPSSSEYKIVHLFEAPRMGNRNMECEVLSFRHTGKISLGPWRGCRGCPWSAYTEKTPLCVHGNIYWARSSGRKDRSILSFDLEKEDFSILNYPSCDFTTYSFLEFTGIKGSLFVLGCSAATSTMDGWLLDKDEKGWLLEYRISQFPFAVNFLISSDNRSEEVLIHTEQKGLIRYNVRNQTSRRIKYFVGVRSYNKPCLYHYSLTTNKMS
ncbi:UNVERIFIED_CONTAM: putative F-box/LRR-repeat/kelch-repeat protein [Sesamum radiatum]|uniref:F-box/LRR-repeat/kelch-repeat protein n=1 Tax=Sesamum radiatum TaxID=300843 RepID=A0AAW2R4P4_SESRA